MIKIIFNIRNPVFVKIFHIRIFLTKITTKGYFFTNYSYNNTYSLPQLAELDGNLVILWRLHSQ